MKYQIPNKPQEFVALRQQTVSEELVAAVIVGVVTVARQEGRSLEELRAEVLADDPLLDKVQRRWLSEVVSDVWWCLGEHPTCFGGPVKEALPATLQPV